MNIAMMQPTFLPWLGFFELICKSDIFIILDDFQFSKQSFQQRNRLFVNQGQLGWYSVPVNQAKSFKVPLNKTIINYSIPWQKKMWKRIEQNYRKAKFFNELYAHIKEWLKINYKSLAELNTSFIFLVCRLIKIDIEFRYSSQFETKQKRSERVLELAQWCKADCYLAAKGSFEYMLKDNVFPVEDIEVLFQDFQPQPYQQLNATNGFEPYLSILDTLFNIGPIETETLLQKGTSEFLSWEAMNSVKNIGMSDK